MSKIGIIRINRSNSSAQSFRIAYYLREISVLNELYRAVYPGVNSLMRMLLPIVSEVIWCPENGNWRCAANSFLKDGQAAIFFPWLLPNNNQKSIIVGITGSVQPEEIIEICQKVIGNFEQKICHSSATI